MGRIQYALLVAFVSLCVYVTTTRAGLAKDLPDPPSNIRTVPAGSLILPMDNKQLVSGVFNVKAYGLAVELLWNEVPLYWAIRAGKLKDAKDFSASTTQVFPTRGNTANQDYFSGPFIILSASADEALAVVRAWQGGNHGIRVDKIEAAVEVDIRHEIFTKPKILISNLSTYSPTQTNILNAAGLVKDKHYIVTNTDGIIKGLNDQACYTFFSEPHYIWNNNAPGYYDSVSKFVASGGNFLAECAGAWSYENWQPGSGRGGFQSKAGLYFYNSGNKNLKYPNPDTPYNQFLGTLDGANTGHTPDYCWVPPTNIGNTQVDEATEKTWITNNGYYVVVNDPASWKCTNGQTAIIASVSKPGRGNDFGGLVFFLGAHDWSGGSGNVRDAGKRLYLNALMTPAYRGGTDCNFDFCPPGKECPHDECHTCICDEGGAPKLTKIPGCCISADECAPCSSCINKQCSSNCGECAVCNTAATPDFCETKPCACDVDDDCLPCFGCSDLGDGTKGCLLLSEDCCTQDSDCGVCGFCDFSSPIVPSRQTKPFYKCKSKPNCCEANEDCGDCESCSDNLCSSICTPCQSCVPGAGDAADTCSNVENCCLIDDNCNSCEVCNSATSTCVACPACTECVADSCAPIADCCVLDDECGHCSKCTDNACVSTITGELGSCCSEDDDCTAAGTKCAGFSVCAFACSEDTDCGDCQTCIDDVCQATADCDGGDGDGGSDAARFSSILL